MSKLIEFEKLHNTRDLGGMKTKNGQTIKTGMLFRSGHLSDLPQADVDKLSMLAGTVVDFRTDNERMQQPDAVLAASANFHIPIVDQMTAGISREKEADQKVFEMLIDKPQDAKEYMCRMYRAFASEYGVGQYRTFLQILSRADGSVLWHCTAGKDRAGIASVIVEEILGVSREDIIADYLMTNEFLAEDIVFLTGFVKRQTGIESEMADEALRYLFGAERLYLESYYREAEQRYGSYGNYLREGLGVTDEMEEMLRERYLENV